MVPHCRGAMARTPETPMSNSRNPKMPTTNRGVAVTVTRSAVFATAITFAGFTSFIMWPTPAGAEESSDARSATETTPATEAAAEAADPDSKFAFALDDLGDGTRPDATGTPRPITYEYCIPKQPQSISMVGSTDPTGTVEPREKGTIGCSDDELLARGHTGQPDYLSVMRRIANNDFVKKLIIVDTQ